MNTTQKVDQIKTLLVQAELVIVSFGPDRRHPSDDTPGVRVVIRGGNPELRQSLGTPPPHGLSEIPLLDEGEFELEFGDGFQGARISRPAEPPMRLQGGAEDPGFQHWLEQLVDKFRMETRGMALREDALQWTATGGEGRPTVSTAIYAAKQLGIGSRDEMVATL